MSCRSVLLLTFLLIYILVFKMKSKNEKLIETVISRQKLQEEDEWQLQLCWLIWRSRLPWYCLYPLQFLSFFYCFLNKSQKQNKIDENWQNVYLNITKHGCYFLIVSIINILTFSSVCKFKRKKSSPVRTKILKFTTK